MKNRRARFLTVILLLLVTPLLRGEGVVLARNTAPGAEDRASASSPESAATASEVMASLERVLAWYREAGLVMQAVRDVLGPDVAHDEEQAAQRAVQRAFEAARARAALLAPDAGPDGTGEPARGPRADRRAKLQAALEQDERDVARLRARMRTATAATRQVLEREWAAASNRLELGRVRLDFATKLDQFTSQASGEEADLANQIQVLQDTVPESRGTAPTVATTSPRASPPSGVWTLIYRLLALERSHGSLKDLAARTTEIIESTDAEVRAARQTMRPVFGRLRALAKEPAVNGTALAASQEEFHDLLERAKRLGAVMLPLREESALLHRYATDVQDWKRAVDREIGLVFRGLALELVGVGLALGAIFVGSVVWRVAAVRYVTNPYHRRLLLTARHVVVVTAIALVLVLRFMSELTALVAALGFAAAGIAFALQNVILAVAGYFSMVAPNGIRVGDRVSLQGPFGYVHGEVIEIGVVRTRLQELSGEPLRSTGRILVFPNSVAFTGSFIKHPPAEARSG